MFVSLSGVSRQRPIMWFLFISRKRKIEMAIIPFFNEAWAINPGKRHTPCSTNAEISGFNEAGAIRAFFT